MGNNVKVVINREGVIALMKSSEMMEGCKGIAEGIVSRLGAGYAIDPYPGGKTRINVGIKPTTPETYYDNLRNNTILKAVQS